MTIKDVAKLTGLTTKSIRYYESKGLIQIERNKDNAYRQYSEEDVEKLRLIKILRYLDFSIENIQAILESNQLNEALKKQILKLEKDTQNILDKKEMCENLLKDVGKNEFRQVVDEYNETIDFFESEEGQELKKDLEEVSCPNMSSLLIQTFICLGPILWLFVNIVQKKWDILLFNAALALFATIFLTLQWQHYLKYRKIFKESLKDKNKKNRLMIPMMILLVFAAFALFVFLSKIIELTLPGNYLFYEVNESVMIIFLITVVLMLIILVALVFRKYNLKGIETLNGYLSFYDKGKYYLLALFVAVIYCMMTSMTVVTNETIICKSPFNPSGAVYKYEDVEKIEAGFGSESFAFASYKKKGEFSYCIHLNGKGYTFHQPTVNSHIERYEDAYLELEEFDQALEKLNIEKHTDNKYGHLCDFDQRYIDRFYRITDK